MLTKLLILFSRTDSCDVYGEVDGNDLATLVSLLNCTFSALAYSATLNDIPDDGLREEIKAKITELVMQYMDDADQNATAVETFVSSFDTQPIGSAMGFIIHGNTPEFMEKYGDDLFTGEPTGLLDSEILKIGRPSGGLEYVHHVHHFSIFPFNTNYTSRYLRFFNFVHIRDMDVTCDIIQEGFQSLDALNETYTSDPDAYTAGIRETLNASLSPLINLYKCGDIDTLKASGIFDVIENGEDLKTFERNNQMVAKMHDILTTRESDEKITFAIGLAHWLFGSENMISLLEGYGYSLELIPEWNDAQAENPSNEFCGVVENPDVSLFSPSIYVDEASLNATIGPSTAPEDMSMIPTATTEDNSLAIETSSPTSASEDMTTDTTVVPPTPPSSEGVENATNSPTAIPIEKEPSPSSDSTAIELSKVILFVWGWIALIW